jgi:hypothetical protein
MIHVDEMIVRLFGGPFTVPQYYTLWKDLYFVSDENLDTFIDQTTDSLLPNVSEGVSVLVLTNKQLELIW